MKDEGNKETVRDASDIVRVVGEHLALKPKGREYVGLCPFHDDHNPSMAVVPHKQIFHCFVCGAGGDVFSFIQRYHSMDFREALEFLANRAGIELTRSAPTNKDDNAVSRADLADANKTASKFFGAILRHPEHGKAARDLIERREIDPETADAFAVGASPDRWDGLVQTIAKKGLDPKVYREAGLLKQRDSGGDYDALRNRLVFPIHDQIGRVIAFGGRRIDDDDEPKYLNSPETRLFHKSSALYGIHQAARAIQRERTAIIVEGYVDVIACHQAGFANTVGTLGTALTKEHAALLRRLCETVVLLFDADDAGARASDRAAEVFFAEPIDVKVATLEGAKDPDDLLKTDAGIESFRAAIDGAQDLLAFRFERLRRGLSDVGPSALSRALETELESLAALGLNELPPLRRRLVLRSLSGVTGLDEATIAKAIPSGRTRRRTDDPEPEHNDQAGSDPHEVLLGCLLIEPTLHAALPHPDRDLIAPERYASRTMQQVARVVHELLSASLSPDLASVLARTDDLDAQSAAVALADRTERETDHDPERLRTHWEQGLTSARRRRVASQVEPAPIGAMDKLEKLRRNHDEFGPDYRALPRKGGAR